ncbi:tRNA pseudouridine synthase-like 1 [Pollicipes pollicipes]|uniref:tRNA pseudouridine synthase-like 1 n=1 Tax=Pollicipes pollicipes TaxID=41117 RepID=UPI0018859818|nr:tRNA pseudouridine synthase-like 1 [Pollicipes pollicipes]
MQTCAVVPAVQRDRLRECAELLSGEHDFRSFMGTRKGLTEDLVTRRHLDIELRPGATCVDAPHLQFWDIVFSSKGFLYRQVRRTVAVLVAVAQGRLSLEDVQHLLDVPSKDSWNPRAATAPPHGLYLQHVVYDPADLAEGE